MTLTQLFINLVKIRSDSDESAATTPSTVRQFDIARYIADVAGEFGFSDIKVTDNCYVYATLPATKDRENIPTVALIAHMDTVTVEGDKNINPRIIDNYDGGEVKLGDTDKILSPETFPHLKELKGQSLIVTDGQTCLGADDKAGIAEILWACKKIKESGKSHGTVKLCFTPDEEIGHGAALLDIERVNADFGYTVDGDDISEINFETFNAAEAVFDITGVSVHPGSAKGIMINASLVAAEIIESLPKDETPSYTEGYEGFYHLDRMQGDVEKATLCYILRDHDANKLKIRKETMQSIERKINETYGEGTVKLTIKDQYRNMAEILKDKPEALELGKMAIQKLGLTPQIRPIRGGTDGSCLSFRGLPCPNIGTGGYAFHGPFEHITAERLELATELIRNIITDIQ